MLYLAIILLLFLTLTNAAPIDADTQDVNHLLNDKQRRTVGSPDKIPPIVTSGAEVGPKNEAQVFNELLSDQERRLVGDESKICFISPVGEFDSATMKQGSSIMYRYEVQHKIRTTALTKTFQVLDHCTNSIVALKLERDPKHMAFTNEIQEITICRQRGISFENILSYHSSSDLFLWRNMKFMKLSAFDTDLRTAIRKSKQIFSREQIENIAKQVASGIMELHKADQMHGSLTAANVALRYKNGEIQALITDIGGRVRQEANRQDDIYSLCLIITEMHTRESPDQTNNQVEELSQSSVNDFSSASMIHLLKRCKTIKMEELFDEQFLH